MENTNLVVRIEEKTKKTLEIIADHTGCSKSEIVHEAIDQYFSQRLGGGVETLKRMAEKAREKGTTGPGDIVENHDKYLYEGGSRYLPM